MDIRKQIDTLRQRNIELSKQLEEAQSKSVALDENEQVQNLILELETIKDNWIKEVDTIKDLQSEYALLISELKDIKNIMKEMKF